MEYLGIVVGGCVLAFVWGLVLQHKRKMKELELRGADPELGAEIDALRDDMTDIQERLDLAERLLAAGRKSQEDTSG